MDASSKISGLSRKNAEDYSSLEEILADVELLSQDNFIQSQAVEVIERFLKKKSPNVLVGIERVGEHMNTRDSIMTRRSVSLVVSPSQESGSYMSHASSPALTSRSMMHSSGGAPRVSTFYRLEMIDRELDDGKMTMGKLRRRFESAKFLLQVEEENLREELQNLEESQKLLETFIIESADKKTLRLHLDKYSRFLENELNSKDRELRKMKLKTKTYQTEYNRLKSQQQQKMELREKLHPVDLEKLDIENEELRQQLEQKTKQLLDFKKAVGKRGQSLVLIKSKLNDTVQSLKNVAQDIKQREEKFMFTQNKETQNTNDLMAAKIQNQSIKKLNSTYKSPDVHSYLMMTATLDGLRKEKEAWERRCRYQKQTLTLLEHQVKQLAPTATKSRSNKSMRISRSAKSLLSSRSTESILKRSSDKVLFPHPNCTPSSPC